MTSPVALVLDDVHILRNSDAGPRCRCAEWYERNGALGEALEYRMKAGDVDGTARLAGVQAVSVYRKLGASSRSQAIARCRELGLLEG
jgi:ATP/maltotriose-dependent transcriptional regulator MalT